MADCHRAAQFFSTRVIMQTAQGNMLQSLRTVQAFLDDNAAKLPDVVKTDARQRLDDAVLELSGHASDQTGSALASQGATLKQRTLRRSVTTWRHLTDREIGS
jgi:aminopeptidase N